jgi:guanosine-3',5'-bis(diphosphate) 3'-pyrophosphohydrolase
LDSLFEKIKSVNTIEGAKETLSSVIEINETIQKAVDFCIEAHKNQTRKSGEPYSVHPILVASITAYFSNDEAMVIAALLHDVVEDTHYSLEDVTENYGGDVSHIVYGLTKISELGSNQKSQTGNDKNLSSALSFRKMLIASISDVRILVVKLCDRTHNMLTLDALKQDKQQRIAEETIVVYAPIAHRLGISSIKNVLEDLSFYYLYPVEYEKIDDYLKVHQQKLHVEFNKFISKVEDLLHLGGYNKEDFVIKSRIKHHYSIFLKMQRKGVNIDEVLDVLALRILVKNPIDCYRVLGIIHTNAKPLVSRFKDYVALPKENGYQTIHTTVFNNAKIYEIQIRTEDMDKVAEYGIAAHWKYKNNNVENTTAPSLNWLQSLGVNEENNVEEFYDDAKQDLFSDEIVVYSPKGDVYTLPRGSVAYDFAYAIHSDIGNKAVGCSINKVSKPLITELKNGDIVTIKLGSSDVVRCSWIDMVKTSRAKKSIKQLCSTKNKIIDTLSGKNILNTIFKSYKIDIVSNLKDTTFKNVTKSIDHLINILRTVEGTYLKKVGLVSRLKLGKLKLRKYTFDNVVLYSNFRINSVSFDHCCHPKYGDDIVALGNKDSAIIHHKMCDKACRQIEQNENMYFCTWITNKLFKYNMKVSLANVKGELANLLAFMSDLGANILFIEYGKDKYSHVQYCEIEFEINNEDKALLKQKIEKKTKVIEFLSSNDAYK